MKQTNPSQTPFWKRLFGTAEKKKQEGLDKQTSFSTWQKQILIICISGIRIRCNFSYR